MATFVGSLTSPVRSVWRTSKRTWKGYRKHLHPTVKSVNHRHRHLFYPLEIGVLLLLCWLLASYYPPSAVFAVSTLVAAGVAFLLRRDLDRAVEWSYALSCLGAAVLGLTLTSVIGLDNSTLNAYCVLAWGTASAIWWNHHAIRPARKSAAVKPASDADAFAELMMTRFADRVGQTNDNDD